MSARYAPYSAEEYNCLTPDLEGIREAIALVEAEEHASEIQLEIDSLLKATPSRSQAVERIEQEVSRISEWTESQRGDRKESIKAILDAIRCQMQEEWSIRAIARGRIQEACNSIYSLYSTFDVEAFTEDVKLLISEDNGNTVEDRIKQLNKEKSDIQRQIKKNWNGRRMEKFLRFVPDVWRDRKITDRFTREDMAVHILKTLISDWRERCTHYTVAVTVGGVNIHTLEATRFELWMEFYERLGLKPGPKAIFRFRDAEHRGNRRVGTEGLPGFFGSGEPGEEAEVEDDELSRI